MKDPNLENDVKDLRVCAASHDQAVRLVGNVKASSIVAICDAYLAQEKELKRKDKLIKMQDGFITDKSKIAAERSTQISQLEVELDQLKAENQALKAKIAQGDIYDELQGDEEFNGR